MTIWRQRTQNSGRKGSVEQKDRRNSACSADRENLRRVAFFLRETLLLGIETVKMFWFYRLVLTNCGADGIY